jgi:TRAP-type C4-dicarboxylate transport system permease small subunit
VIQALVRFDDRIYRTEKAVAALMIGAMGLVVFLDVLQRVSTRQGSWLASPVYTAPPIFLLVLLGLRTRGEERALGKAVGITLGLMAARFLFLRLLPNGIVWSQTFALALTLWLGMLGASLAAHERRHLALDVGSKLWPKSIAGKVAGFGHFVTAAFCLLVLVLGWRSVTQHWDLWTSTDHAAGNLSGLPIPKWFPASAIVVGMGVLTFRFALEGVRTWTGELQVGGDDTLKQLGIEERAQ